MKTGTSKFRKLVRKLVKQTNFNQFPDPDQFLAVRGSFLT